MDCCAAHTAAGCSPADNDWTCCTAAAPCAEGEVSGTYSAQLSAVSNTQGDCDRDSECAGELVCGKDNCAAGHSAMDCCVPAAAAGK